MVEFKALFQSIGNLDPFAADCTLASACLRIFQNKFLGMKELGVTPAKGYSDRAQFSMLGIRYLKWVEHSRQITIQHALSPNGETQVGLFKVDGLCVQDKVMFEVNGCFYHGCRNAL